jgi:formylglycine-generating enzyme required for sulfatase activity
MSRRTRTLVQVGGVLLFLALLGLGGVAVSGLFSGAAAGEASILLAGPETAAPNLILEISPPRAEAAFSGTAAGRFPLTGGNLELVAPPGPYVLTLSAAGFRSQRLEIELGAGPSSRLVELEPVPGPLRVRSVPGARLDVRGPEGDPAFLATVPASGLLELPDRLLAKNHSFALSHPLHKTAYLDDVVLTVGEWTELTVALVPRRVPVEVRSEPLGALVRVNGVEVGRTPLVISEVPVHEPVAFEVGGGPWRSWKDVVQPSVEGPNLIATGPLEPSRGRVELRLTLAGETPGGDDLGGLRVTLDELIVEGPGGLVLDHPAGTYSLRVEHPDYLAKAGEVTVVDLETTALELDLRPRPAVLRVDLPPGQEVVARVGAERLAMVDGRLRLEARQPVEIILEAPDFQPVRQTFVLAANAEERWSPAWEPLPGPVRGENWTPPRLDLPFAWVPAGEFQMGSPLEEPMRRPNEGPTTRIRHTSGFWAGITEIPQDVYEALMDENPSQFRGGRLPVDSVTWARAREFCDRLTARERAAGRLPAGFVYRLPTEAEWEYCARAGTTTPFSFGSRVEGGEAHIQGRYPRDFNRADLPPGPARSLPVGSFPPNRWGLFDVHGNVAEWTLDAYNDRLPGGEQTDYRRRGEGRGVPVRGGSWSELADRCRSAARDTRDPTIQLPFIGFRVLLAPPR